MKKIFFLLLLTPILSYSQVDSIINAKINKAVASIPQPSLDSNKVKQLIANFASSNFDSVTYKKMTSISITPINADTLFVEINSAKNFEISVIGSGNGDAGIKHGEVAIKNINGTYSIIESPQFKDSMPPTIGDIKIVISNNLPIIKLFPSSNQKINWVIQRK